MYNWSLTVDDYTLLHIFKEGPDPQKSIVPDAIALQLEEKSIDRNLIEGLWEVH